MIIVKSKDDLDWFVDDKWSSVAFDPKDKKTEITQWLYEECEDDFLLASWTEYNHINGFMGSQPICEMWFRDVGEAMMFKLAWGGGK